MYLSAQVLLQLSQLPVLLFWISCTMHNWLLLTFVKAAIFSSLLLFSTVWDFAYLFIYLTFQPLEFLAKKMFLHFLHCHFLPSWQILVPKTFWGRSPPTSPGRSLKILFDHPGDVPIWRPEDVLKWRPRDVLIWCPRDNPARLIRGFLKVIQ